MLKRFTASLELRGLTEYTIKQYLYDLRFYQKHLTKDVTRADVRDLQSYLMHLKTEHGYQNKSLNRRIALLRTFYGFLKDEGVRDDNPALALKYPKISEKAIPFLSEHDIQRILDNVNSQRDRLIIKLPFYEGLRRLELLRLRKKDIDFDRKTLLINGKGNKQRVLPLHNELASELMEYTKGLSLDGCLFPITDRHVNEIVEKYGKIVGIRLHPHLIRHSFASNLYKKSKNVWLVGKMLGHTKLETTVKYLRSLNIMDTEFVEEYQKAFSGILS